MRNMKKIFLIFLIFLFTGCSTYVEETINAEFTPMKPVFEEFRKIEASNGSIYSGSSAGLFSSDRRAHKVGDILTVTLNETFSSSKSISSASSKADVLSAEIGPTGVLRNFAGLGGAASKTNTFAGSGSAAQSNSLTGFLSVTVVRVFPNGNLEIKGQKKLRLTEGSEYIRIKGIVRPQDISATNYVSSSQIAEAQIEYVGAGSLANEARPGWGSKLFRAFSPF